MASFPTYADQYGFILIYPTSNSNQGYCWDNHSPKSLTRDGGGDTQGLVQQVRYTLTKYGADSSRVYIVGFSSGGMMANDLAATYPDIFEAAVSFSGTAACCWAGAGGSTPFQTNNTCGNGQVVKTAQEWGNFARNTYPGFTGRRPRMQIWHGGADNLIYPQNYQEELKQWSNVLGQTLTSSNQNTPDSGYTQSVYGDGTQLVGYLAAGVGHLVPFHETAVLKFFGIPGSPTITTSSSRTSSSTSSSSSTTSRTTTTRTTAITTTGGIGPQQMKWGQCGGIGWTGATVCISPAACSTLNPYYAQCL
ncbi:hypothetical protein H072_4263 [Dactylellina haptotyla CBS 200.50]|uniref:CBM1 domain-containing protein n=1 Tax=Dactylellina haptotyla (strain CBS 200.50) TaxID=1284197 RepID=S8AL45_DACHA|nr:hypothetical protein H072_4263 [Dactylellina haptotyla CBS 200.50]